MWYNCQGPISGTATIRLLVRDSGSLSVAVIHQVDVSEQSLDQLFIPLVGK